MECRRGAWAMGLEAAGMVEGVRGTGRPETGQPFHFSCHHSDPHGEDPKPAATRLPAVPSVSGKPGPDTRVLAAKLPLGTRQELSDNINIFGAIRLRNLVPTVNINTRNNYL